MRTHSSANAKALWRGMSRISGYRTARQNGGGASGNIVYHTVLSCKAVDGYALIG